MPEFPVPNFFDHRKARAAQAVFVAVLIAIPAYVFSNFEKFVKDKTPYEWLTEKGWWSMAGVKFVAGWLFGAVVLSVVVYGLFSAASWLFYRKKKPSLEIQFEDRSPFVSEGKGNSGIRYKTRRVAVVSSVGGKVSLKIPELSIGKANYPNVQLRPIENQPDELEAGEVGYWYIVQMNSQDNTVKIVHKGNDTYSLGKGGRFELIARCAGLTKKVWCQTVVEGDDLNFSLADKESDLPNPALEDLDTLAALPDLISDKVEQLKGVNLKYSDIGERLRTARLEAGMSVPQLVAKIKQNYQYELGQTTIHAVERGMTPNPGIKTIKFMALGVGLDPLEVLSSGLEGRSKENLADKQK